MNLVTKSLRNKALLTCILLGLCGFPTASAEEVIGAGESPTEPAKSAEDIEKEEQAKREAALLEVMGDTPLERSPQGALRALVQELLGKEAQESANDTADGAPPEMQAAMAEVEELRRMLFAANWSGLENKLTNMPEKLSAQIYKQLLRRLRNSTLLPAEVIQLANLDPSGAPKNNNLKMLARLLRASIAQVGSSRSLVLQLNEGIGRFGGQGEEGRALAAGLFLEANHILEAGQFLPNVDLAEASGDVERIALHARYLSTLALAENNAEALSIAWRLNELLLNHPDRKVDGFFAASQRALDMLPMLPPAEQTVWLKKQYGPQTDPANRALPMALLTEQVASLRQMAEGGASSERLLAQLQQLHEHIDLLLAGDAAAEVWKVPLNMAVMSWMQEARYGINVSTLDYWERRDLDRQPLNLPDLLQWAPSAAWREYLDSALAEQVNLMTAQLVVSQGEHDQALALIKTVYALDPMAAAQLGGQLLSVWRSGIRQNRHNNHHYYYGGGGSISGIPTTRATQARRLDELSLIAVDLRETLGEHLQAGSLVQAFIAAHAPAEVFRLEDIRRVLGPEEQLDPAALSMLVATMRNRLAREWRSQDNQQQGQTTRNTAQLVAELERGYALLDSLLAPRLDTGFNPELYNLYLQRGMSSFAHAEFLYSQQVALERYTTIRDAAFQAVRNAADGYKLMVSDLPADGINAQIFLQWFMMATGTSEVSYLSRQGSIDQDQMKAIDEALGSMAIMGTEMEAWHRQNFAEALLREFGSIPGHSREKLLLAALPLCGDYPKSQWIKERLAIYDGLKAELRLQSSLPNGSSVGQGAFPLYISLQATGPIMRESNELRVHLQNQVNVNGESVDYRGDLEDHLRKRLDEHFEIIDLRLADHAVTLRHLPESGWRELPLAMLVLKARDPAVDQIPSLRKDLDFAEDQGTLTLAVTSDPLAIDAQGDADLSGVDDLALDLQLDDRDSLEGSISLHVEARGKGLVPDFASWLPADAAGDWELVEAPASALTLSSLDSDGTEVSMQSRRRSTWIYRLKEKAAGSDFIFPQAALPIGELVRARYQGMQSISADKVVQIMAVQEQANPWVWLWSLLIIPVLALVAIILGRQKPADQAVSNEWLVNADASAGSLLTYLRRVVRAPKLSAEEVKNLRDQVANWESQLYRSGSETSQETIVGELRKCAMKYQQRLSS